MSYKAQIAPQGSAEHVSEILTSWNARFTIVLLVLITTAFFMNTRVARFQAPRRISSASLPTQLADWNGADVPLPKQAFPLLRGATLLQRAYFENGSVESEVYLYVAYYPNQRAGDRRHLPEGCLDGSGWSTVESGSTKISLAGQQSLTANRLLIAKQGVRQLVLYWFWARGRDVASEQWADAYLILDSLRFHRSDDALIRINTAIAPSEDVPTAERRLLAFTALAVPAVHNYFPR
jgi:EpsI family protein